MAVNNGRMNMTEGPLLKKLLVYTLPVMATGVLQFLYNAADTAIVGRFAEDSETALAAVGSTGVYRSFGGRKRFGFPRFRRR